MENERQETCGERIKKALRIKGMRQSDLCQITKIPKSAISQYISGAFEPKQDRVYLISKALNVSEAWLMGFDVPMERSEKQKKNDNLAEIIVRLRNDDDFSNCVNMLNKLQPHQYESIKQLLSAFSQK